jgi:LmbE family N-acetylglucosaminyl deacetylase
LIPDQLRLMCILAHPDDETLGFGGALAAAAADGIETYVVTATRGERGWFGDAAENPGLEALGRTREAELRSACEVLGVREVTMLGYVDGELDDADAHAAIARIAAQVRRIRPHVVLTFPHDGIYGHPDHIAISQLATAAVVAAAAQSDGEAPHAVSKLYYRAPSSVFMRTYEAAFGDLVMQIDGAERRGAGWPDWTINAHIDATPHWRRVWKAAQCHTSQLPGYERLARLQERDHEIMWGRQEYYRAMSLVSSGRSVESDLFAGLRGAK